MTMLFRFDKKSYQISIRQYALSDIYEILGILGILELSIV